MKNINKLRKRLLLFDELLIVLTILLLGVFRPDIVLIISYFILIIYLLITKRKLLLFHLAISSLLSLLWLLISYQEYNYNQDFLIILNLNTFPFFSFSLGLFALYLIYSHYEYKLKNKLKDTMSIRVSKKSLIKLAIESSKENKKGLEKLEEYLLNCMPALLTSNEDPFKIAKKLNNKIYTLCICNSAESTITRESDLTFLTHAGPEIGVASTKAFTTQLVALALLTCSIGVSKKNIS